MLQVIPPQDENNTEKFPVIVTFDKGSVWLKQRGKPAKKITALAWAALAAMFLVLINPF
jgi:hypothetical protein